MTEAATVTAAEEWRRNWTVVLAGMLGGLMVTTHIYSMGVMLKPIEQTFGWSRMQISSGGTIVAVIGVLMAPLAGNAIDRFGPRRIALIFGLLYCGTVALLSTATSSVVYWWVLWALLGFAYSFLTLTLWTTGVSSLFHTSRGLAQAITLCGTALASTFMPIVSVFFLERFGWRTAYVCLAVFWGALILPMIFLFFSSAADKQRSASAASGHGRNDASLPGFTARQGFRSPAFIKLAIASGAMSLAVSALFVNMVPILNSQGIPLAAAAGIAGLMGIGTIVGRVAAGFMLDRVDAKVVAAISTAVPVPAALMLIAAKGSVLLCTIAVPMLGMAMGAAVNAIAYLAARHFGMRSFGTLFGTITGMLVLWNGVAPLLGNWAYDRTHSYLPTLWAVVPLSVICATLMAWMGRYPDFSPAASEPELVAEAAE